MPEGEKARKQESELKKMQVWTLTVCNCEKNILESKVAEHTEGRESFI